MITAAEWITEASRLAQRRETDFLTACWTLLRQQRRKYGGYLVHIGVILMAIGVVGSRAYSIERDVTLPRENPVAVRDYVLTYESLNQETEADHLNISAKISVERKGRRLVMLTPSLKHYVSNEQSLRVPALRPGVREDFYLVLGGWSDDAEAISVQVTINPLINFLWLGGLVFLAGGGFALWPRSTQGMLNVLAIVVGLSLLVGAGWAMWGIPHGATRPRDGRPEVGQPAPNFEVTLLNGSSAALEGIRGSATILIFWNSQCPICKQTLPKFQTVWENYAGQDVVVLSIAVGDSRAEAQQVTEELGIDYPTGLDPTGEIASRYGITGVPETFLVDRRGRLSYTYVGAVNMSTLISRLDQLLIDPDSEH
jgi:cytochrome c-type biogenesis protein CcmF